MLETKVAYFSMEIALDPAIPTYGGGLGVLAGDTLRSAADLEVAMAAVTLVHRKGYFKQTLDEEGNQSESPSVWQPEDVLELMKPTVTVTIEGRLVRIRAWHYRVEGFSSHVVPVYLLDTDLEENTPWDRTLTDRLYHGDDHYRLCQEVVLGMGGAEMLHALGHTSIESFHMNEGHSALLVLALLRLKLEGRRLGEATEEDLVDVRGRCIFTTHTPVPAGHDQFSMELVRQVLGDEASRVLERTGCCHEGRLNMTYMAMRCSRYINGVAMHHGEVSRGMFPSYPVRAITNGVHAVTWTSSTFRSLFDRYIPEWRHDNLYLRYALGIPLEEIRQAHVQTKRALIAATRERTGEKLEETLLTIGFARRASTYKRADLLFTNLDRLKWIARHIGPFQVVYGGKAHPDDKGGKDMIRSVVQASVALRDTVQVIYLEDYDLVLAKRICSGVDLWLNTPQRPQEASGSSGMKAALNGVPSLSVLDGWWVEGHIEGVTGWSIGHGGDIPEDRAAEAASLYDKLELMIVPMYYGRPTAYAAIMRSAIALNGSFFNTQRMLSQYVANAYFPEEVCHVAGVLE